MTRITVPIVVLLATAGCATVKVDRDPRHWHELRSDHFTVDTDLDADSATAMTDQLERLRLALLMALRPGLEVKQRIHVVVLADAGELRTFEDLPPSGYTNRNAELLVIGSPNRVVKEWVHMHALQIQAHELAHELSFFVIPNQPRWIAEGLASRLETIDLSPDGTEATVGQAFAPYAWFLGQFGPARLSDMWAWRIPAELSSEFKSDSVLYPSAWAWVTWLVTKQPERFAEFVRRDAAGEAPAQAFGEAFPSDVLLDSRPAVALAALKYPESQVLHLPLIHPTITTSALSAADVHAIVAQLWATGPWKIDPAKRTARVMAEVREALASDPKNLAARELEVTWSPVDRKPELARRLAEDHPDSAEAWTMLLDAIEPSGGGATAEGTEALERALALGPSDARILNDLAWALLRRNEVDRAAPLASRALAEQPWRAAVMDTNAAILLRQGRCAAVANLEQAAINAQEEGDAQANRARLHVVHSCREGPGVKPGPGTSAQQPP